MSLHLTAAFAVTVLLATPQAAPTQDATLESSCRVAFAALAANDFDALVATFPTVAEFEALSHASLAMRSPEARAELERRGKPGSDFDALREVVIDQARRRFEQNRSEAAAAFDWETARFVGAVPHDAPVAPIGDSGFGIAPVEFLVWAGGDLWSFGGNDVLRGPRGWAFVEFLSFRGRRSLEVVRAGAPEPDSLLDDLQERRIELERRLVEQEAERVEEREALREQAQDQLRAMHAELEAVRGQLREVLEEYQARENSLLARLDESERERQNLAHERHVDAADEAMRVEREAEERREQEHFTRALALENQALHNAVARLSRAATPSAPDANVADVVVGVEWAAAIDDEPAWRSALRRSLATRLSLDATEVTVSDALRYVYLSAGAEIAVLPSAYENALGRTIDLELDDVTAAEALAKIFAPASFLLHEGHVFVGDPSELARLGRPTTRFAQPTTEADRAAWSALLGARMFASFQYAAATDVLRYLHVVLPANLWWSVSTDEELSEELGLVATGELSAATVLEILAGEADVSGRFQRGVLVLDVGADPSAKDLDALDAEVARMLPGAPVACELMATTVGERLAVLSALLGVELGADAEVLEEMEFDYVADMYFSDVDPAFVLRLVQHELGERFVWKRVGDAAHLVPAKR